MHEIVPNLELTVVGLTKSYKNPLDKSLIILGASSFFNARPTPFLWFFTAA
jgi:hypothetical protein